MKWFGAIADYVRKSLLTTKGDIFKHNGTAVVRFAKGTGQYLILRVNGSNDDIEYAANNTIHDISGLIIRYKVIDIGNWNMDADAAVNIAHGLGATQYILGIYGTVRNDANSSIYPIAQSMDNGVNTELYCSVIDATNIILYRLTGGIFDGIGFDSTPYNRGRIIVTYSATAIS